MFQKQPGRLRKGTISLFYFNFFCEIKRYATQNSKIKIKTEKIYIYVK